MEELNNLETIKICVEEFSRLQEWMTLAEKDSAVYKAMKVRYRDLKVILAASDRWFRDSRRKYHPEKDRNSA